MKIQFAFCVYKKVKIHLKHLEMNCLWGWFLFHTWWFFFYFIIDKRCAILLQSWLGHLLNFITYASTSHKKICIWYLKKGSEYSIPEIQFLDFFPIAGLGPIVGHSIKPGGERIVFTVYTSDPLNSSILVLTQKQKQPFNILE